MGGHFSRVRVPATSFGDGYGLHQALWRLFTDGPGRQRDFLFHHLRDRPGTFYVVSHRPPGTAEGWAIQTREYAPHLEAGQALAFSLRANPTVARGQGDGRSSRHDVVFDARRQALARGDAMTPAEAEQQAGRDWLARRSEAHGFTIEALRVEGYERTRLRKRPQAAPIRFSTLDYTGVLRVADPLRLRDTLLNGIGPAKGFGCGLLLVRRA